MTAKSRLACLVSPLLMPGVRNNQLENAPEIHNHRVSQSGPELHRGKSELLSLVGLAIPKAMDKDRPVGKVKLV
jgi:hypothetical protein